MSHESTFPPNEWNPGPKSGDIAKPDDYFLISGESLNALHYLMNRLNWTFKPGDQREVQKMIGERIIPEILNFPRQSEEE